jgi:hypothetical protein
MTTPAIDFELFDRAMDMHLRQAFGPGWRTMCHQSAKIAAKALRLLQPTLPAELRRVELAGYMKETAGDTQRKMVHIGWIDDPRPVRAGDVRAHFAVVIGDGIYDPTFAQLGTRTTPLDLPEPYFYSPGVLSAPLGFEDFHWGMAERPGGLLCVGYKLQPTPLDATMRQHLMSDSQAKPHARRVAGAYRNLTGK